MPLNPCHFERSAAKIFSFSELIGAESRNPENVRYAMLIQGVSTKVFVLRFPHARRTLYILTSRTGTLWWPSTAKNKSSAGTGKRKSGSSRN
jgi:hypothetical protein